MGNPFGSANLVHLEHDVTIIEGFIAIDGLHNVIGQAPTAAPLGSGPYSLCKGLMKSVGIAGAVVTQPYQSTGFYQFTLDEPWNCLLGYNVDLYEQGAVAIPNWGINANVRANTTSADAGVRPGTNPAIAAQTIQLKFRNASSGAAADITASTGFWLQLVLKRTAIS